MDEPRVVARYAAESAEVVLPLFEEVAADDPRPRAAIEAARVFAHGASLTKLQRVTAMGLRAELRGRSLMKPPSMLHAPLGTLHPPPTRIH